MAARASPRRLSVAQRELERHVGTGTFLTTPFMLALDGQSTRVIPRDVQLDPVTDRPVHVDFMRLKEGTKIVLAIPVRFRGQENSPGIKRGGVVNIVRHEIELLCPVENIPEFIEADLSGLEIHGTLHISNIKLPEGVVPMVKERDFTIASIVAPTSVIEEARAAAAAAAAAAACGAAPRSRRRCRTGRGRGRSGGRCSTSRGRRSGCEGRREEVSAASPKRLSEPRSMTETPLLIAGLGNPGADYARNRHNAGFMAVDVIHESYRFGPWRGRFSGVLSEGKLGGRKTYLLKPMTYMNDSGQSVGAGGALFQAAVVRRCGHAGRDRSRGGEDPREDRRRRCRAQRLALHHRDAWVRTIAACASASAIRARSIACMAMC